MWLVYWWINESRALLDKMIFQLFTLDWKKIMCKFLCIFSKKTVYFEWMAFLCILIYYVHIAVQYLVLLIVFSISSTKKHHKVNVNVLLGPFRNWKLYIYIKSHQTPKKDMFELNYNGHVWKSLQLHLMLYLFDKIIKLDY